MQHDAATEVRIGSTAPFRSRRRARPLDPYQRTLSQTDLLRSATTDNAPQQSRRLLRCGISNLPMSRTFKIKLARAHLRLPGLP